MNSTFKVTIVVILGVVISIVLPHVMTAVTTKNSESTVVHKGYTTSSSVAVVDSATPVPVQSPAQVYDGLTVDQLGEKLNKSLHSTLAGTGPIFAKYSIEMGVDPYLAVAIVLHETGCSYSCSTQVKVCHNVGGMKGSPGCNGTSYKAFATLDEGIYSFIKNLKDNYYSQGLTTPEQMNKKYAASTSWASKVNLNINSIKSA
jgi:hypothetical protein